MGKKNKIRTIPPTVLSQLEEDLRSDGVRFYSADQVPDIFVEKGFIHPNVLEKCSTITAAASACPGEGRRYLFLTPVRVDTASGKYVTDLDPLVMVVDLDTGTPATSGIVRFHGDFEGRTEALDLTISTECYDLTVDAARKAMLEVGGREIPFEEAPERFRNCMLYMADVYKKHIG